MKALQNIMGGFYAQGELAVIGLGYNIMLLWQTFFQLQYLPRRIKDLVHQIELSAFGGFPVALIVGTFTGMVLALQAGIELARYGQEENIGALVAASMCREMGPVMTGYILAGLIGSTMAAELGTMKVSEEIDALEVMSINPVNFLVLPRVVAMALVCPLLTIYTNLIGILGGAVIGNMILNVNFNLYFRYAQESLDLKDIYSGLFKSFVFGITIALVGCAQGLRAQNGAAGVGRATMRAVVISFIAILIFDYLLTWLFYWTLSS
ncbi:MAG: ABC transporter permease [Planctomycetes bacterium]|nr:ABC transporter permease [Planctomycetota bacterium]